MTKSLVLMLGATLASATTFAAPPPDHCYDFSNMDPNASYTVGDVVDTRFATINIKPYFVDGEPAIADTRGAEQATSQLAGGSSPELKLNSIAINIVPNKPVTRIKMRIAQNYRPDEAFGKVGIGVNKRGWTSEDGFIAADGKVIGTNGVGKAKISVDLSPIPGGNWHQGTLELHAVQGQIENIRLGAQFWTVDDVCLWR